MNYEIMEYFVGRSDNCATQEPGSKQFKRLERGFTTEDYRTMHLTGLKCFGFYLMREDNTVRCSCVDFDNHEEQPDPEWKDKAERTYFFLQELGLEPTMEMSQSGSGCHAWLFFEEWVPAWLIRKFWKAVGAKLKIGYDEIYPRQDFLKGKGVGSLIRLPYWNKSRFIDIEEDWEDTPFDGASYVSRSELEDLCVQLGVSPRPPEDTTNIPAGELPHSVQRLLDDPESSLYRKWNKVSDEGFKGDESDSAWAFYIACELVYQRIHTDVIRKTIEAWCLREGQEHRLAQQGWLDTVINGAYEKINSRLGEASVKAETLIDCAHNFLSRVGKDFYFSSGISVLDHAIDGIGSGEVGILAARPGHGKSALSLHWAIHQGLQGVNCLILNAEMSSKEIGKRVVMQDFSNEGIWEHHGKEILRKIRDKWEGKSPPFYRPVGTIDDVENNIKEFVERKRVQLVVVDYVQLLRSPNSNGRYETVTEISQRIKGAARDNDVAILALCQVSREVERRDRVEFQGSDLRESGQLEQDADLILFCWSHSKSTESPSNQYEIHVAKRRNGPIRENKVILRFEPDEQRFYG